MEHVSKSLEKEDAAAKTCSMCLSCFVDMAANFSS